MNFLHGFLILILFLLVGDLFSEFLDLPVPGSVIGMLLLFGFLVWNKNVPDAIGETSDGLIRYIGLLFVPAGAGISMYLALIAEQWQMILVASFGSTVLTLIFTALIFKLLSKTES